MARIKDLIGENVVAWGSHFFCKMPGDGKRVSWHQDSSYWPLTPSMAVTAWLAIDDATIENACMRFIPGSHHLGHLTYTLSENDEGNVLNQTVPGAENFWTASRCGTECRGDFHPQRPAVAWIRSESIEQTTLRADSALLPGYRESGSGLERERGRCERERRIRSLGESAAAAN